MLIKWTATDGTPQEIGLRQLIEHEQAQFAQYVERLPEQPTARQINRANKMLTDIGRLEATAHRIKQGRQAGA